MSRELKYIIVVPRETFLETPILFSPLIMHSHVGLVTRGRDVEIASAGFCEIGDDGKVFAYGRSESLNIDSRPGDALIIERLLKTPTV